MYLDQDVFTQTFIVYNFIIHYEWVLLQLE
jgi:hypothetical protein